MKKTVIALGFFDGVHIGHAAILRKAALLAREKGASSAACTFSMHPRALFGENVPMLTEVDSRCALIRVQGIDEVFVLPFDKAMADMSPEAFARLLQNEYSCVCAVCGTDFRFGKMAQGTPADLERFGIETVVCPPVMLDGEVVSSTLIRACIAAGEITRAARMLGRPFCIDGSVVGGFHIGRELGYPTMNLRTETFVTLPHGVFAAFVRAGGERKPAVTNIGTRPTFSGAELSVESHIIDFHGDIYGQRASVELLQKLRDERRFASAAELKEQIEKDVQVAKKICTEVKI